MDLLALIAPFLGGCSLGHSLRAALHCLRVLMPQRKPFREAEAQVPLRGGAGGSPCLAADGAGRGVRKGPEPLLPPPCNCFPLPAKLALLLQAALSLGPAPAP